MQATYSRMLIVAALMLAVASSLCVVCVVNPNPRTSIDDVSTLTQQTLFASAASVSQSPPPTPIPSLGELVSAQPPTPTPGLGELVSARPPSPSDLPQLVSPTTGVNTPAPSTPDARASLAAQADASASLGSLSALSLGTINATSLAVICALAVGLIIVLVIVLKSR